MKKDKYVCPRCKGWMATQGKKYVTTQSGYHKSDALLGAILFGAVGAVLATDEPKKIYKVTYKCVNCGLTHTIYEDEDGKEAYL